VFGVEWALAETDLPPIGVIDMPKLVLAASLMAAFVLVACSTPTPPPSEAAVSPPPSAPSVSAPPASPVPSAPAEPSPVPTPDPTVRPTPKPTPLPTEPSFNRAERYLVDGIMRGEGDCSPVRSGLPPKAIGGIDCDLIGSPVARIGYYLFRSEADTLDAYFARMRAEGIGLESGDGCLEREGDNAYIPWDPADGIAPYRYGCFINDEGYANYRITLPGANVYIGLLGRTADFRVLDEWAFLGSVDTPGSPTLWAQSSVYRP
jgi:hypothetical protein